MAKINPGQYTALVQSEPVLFLIGMRINRFWKIHKWLPVALAMGPMLSELIRNPSKGLLWYRVFPGLRNITVIQYWRSFADLEHFARAKDEPHRPAWQRFNQRVGTKGDVGIWHETYLIAPGTYECIYSNMPRFGLAAATEHVPAGRLGQAAAYRMKRAGIDRPAEPVPD
jgi:hypothetical protein